MRPRAGILCFVLTFAACANDTPLTDIAGQCAPAFTAELCTWARAQGESVVETGAVIPIAAIENAPQDHVMSWPPAASATVAVPEKARTVAGFTDLTFFWEPMGHPPGPYMTPHFDFHFYLIPEAERLAIDCTDISKPAALPTGYILPDETLPDDMAKMTGVKTLVGICVPQMGMHSLPEKEFTGTEAFRGTMVIGYYKGQPIFIEPMISKAMLMEKKSFTLPIPSIPGLATPHPTVFRADYDAATQSYRFTFSGFSNQQ